MLLAKDKGECLNQYCHHIMSKIKRIDDGFSIDVGWRNKIPASPANHPIYLKVDAPAGTQFDIKGAERQPCLRTSEKSFLKLSVSGMEKKIIIRPRDFI
jgi:hypothetical protein